MAELHNGIGYAIQAYLVMQKTYDNQLAKGAAPAEIVAAIDAGYPWERRGTSHRYRRWLDARREFFEDYNLPGLRPIERISEAIKRLNLSS